MIYFKSENYKVIQWTQSAESAANYGLTEICDDDGLEQAYDGAWYVKGYAPEKPLPTNEEQRQKREKAYVAETDPIQIHIDRLKDKEQTPEIVAEIQALRIERDEKIEAIKERYPYYKN